MITTTFDRPEFSWSLVSPTPITSYIKELDMYVTFIAGYAMPRNVAAALLGEYFFNVTITNSVKSDIEADYSRFVSMISGHESTITFDLYQVKKEVTKTLLKHWPKNVDYVYRRPEVFQWLGFGAKND